MQTNPINQMTGQFWSYESPNVHEDNHGSQGSLSDEAVFTYKTIPMPQNFPFQAICDSRKRKRESTNEEGMRNHFNTKRKKNYTNEEDIRNLFDIRSTQELISGEEFKELNALACTVNNCIELYKLSEDPWKDEFCSRATKNAVKFFDEYSEVHKKLKSQVVFHSVFQAIDPLFEILCAKSSLSQDEDLDFDLLLKSLIRIASAQEEKEHTFLGYFFHLKSFLYRQFWKCYEIEHYGTAKTAFFYYIWSLGDRIPKAEEEKIEKAKKPLGEIFRSLRGKSYVPYDCSDIKKMTDGMISLMHMDLFLLAFFYQFEQKVVNKIDREPLNLKELKKLRIRDWKLLRPFPPEDLTERREVYTELLSATSNAKLNSVAEMQITCTNQVEFSTGLKRNIRFEREDKRDLVKKMVCEDEVLTQLKSTDRNERSIDQRLHDSIEKTKENTIEDEHLLGEKRQRNRGEEQVRGESLSATDRNRDQHSTAREKAFEEGDRWQESSIDAQEDGVEMTDALRQRCEKSNETAESRKKRGRVAHEYGLGGGGSFDILKFIPCMPSANINLNFKRTSEEEKEEGSSSKQGNLKASEKEDKKIATESTKEEHQRSRNQDQIKKDSHRTTEDETREREQEHSQDQKFTLFKKTDLENTDEFRKRVGLKGQGRKSQDNETGIKRIQSFDQEKEERCSVRNNFNFENARSILNHSSKEYTTDLLEKKMVESRETFALKQGHLLISKVEYMRKILLTPVKFVVEMDYDLTEGHNKFRKLKAEDIPPYLHPLLDRIQALATHRFHEISYDMRVEAGPLMVKNLALEIWNDDRASHDQANQLNIIFHRLGRFLDSICDRPSEQAWAQYNFHKNAYIEEASLKYCEDAARSLQGMFMAFHGNSAICGTAQFLRLHSEFQGKITGGVHSQLHLLPPNRDSGILFHKEPAHGLLLGQKQLTLQDSYKNLLVVGSVGCGKTSRIIIPNLLQLENCSILVTDVDGEIYNKTVGPMERKGFEVRVINIQDEGKGGDRFNPLDHLTSAPESYDDIRRSVDCMMKARGFDETKAEKNAFWVIGGKMILEVALRLILLDKAKGNIPEVTLAVLHQKIGCLTKEELERFVKEKETEGRKVESDVLKVMAQSVISGENSFLDRASYAKSALDYCSSPVVKGLTGSSTIDFSQIRKKPTVIYLKIGQTQLSQYQFLLSLFYNRFFSTCYKESGVGAISGHSSLPVVCLMDEFGHTPIPDFHSRLTTNRKHEISVVAVVQSISQVMELYGERNGNTMIGGGFASKLYFSLDPSDVQIARNISDAYGKVMAPGGRTIEASGLVSHREEEKEGLKIEEIMYPGAGNATFVHTGYKPIKLRLTPYFEDERFQGLMHEKSPSRNCNEASPLKPGPLSKEEAVDALINLLKEKKPNLNGQRVRKLAQSGNKESIRSFLSRQGFSVDDRMMDASEAKMTPFEVRMKELIDLIFAERQKLFECVRFKSLDVDSQNSIKVCVDFAKSASNEELLDAFVEMLDLLYENEFTSSEIIQLEEIGFFSTKKPELGLLIFQNLYLQYRLNKGNISNEEILKGLELISRGFTKEDTEEYWKSLIELIQTMLKQIYEDKLTLPIVTSLALASIGRLTHLASLLPNPIQNPEFRKIIDELKRFDALPSLVRDQTFMIEGQKWKVIKTEVAPEGLIIEIEKIERVDRVKKKFRFNKENGEFIIIH